VVVVGCVVFFCALGSCFLRVWSVEKRVVREGVWRFK
jgi:hypothetical protein